MNRNYFLGIVAAALLCLLLIFFSVGREIQTPVAVKPAGEPPPVAPFKSYISGVGIVEASSGNIFIGTTINRVIKQVFVKEGEKVKKGDLLLTLENRDLEASLKEQQFAYENALLKLKRLEAFPRKEDLLTAEAALKSAEAELQLAKTKNERAQNLPDPRAISQEEKNRRQFEYQQAEAKLLQANADLAKTKEGTWKPDLEIARLEVEQAKASLAKLNAEIGQTMIRAPFDGTVLQIKVHAGESPPLDSFRTPLIIFGDIEEMHLRVSINQLDIPYFHPDAPAVAYLQGDARVKFPLHFVRVEPFLVNKQNLTNELTEIVNTRVLHIIYRIDKDHNRLFVGQQMDVFIETHYPS